MPQRYANIIIAHHLIWTLYGHWPPNDLRGSGSDVVYDADLAAIGPIHHGRKPAHVQPSRAELRTFHKRVEEVLFHPLFWIDVGGAKRQAWANAFREVVRRKRYTVFACAILKNHAHIVIRRHRDDALTMWNAFAEATIERLRAALPTQMREVNGVPHPILAARPYKVFLRTPDEVRGRITYVDENPEKEGLANQIAAYADFVKAYGEP